MSRVRRPSDPALPLGSIKKKPRMVKMEKPEPPGRVTEGEYLLLAKCFQEQMHAKIEEIAQLKKQVSTMEVHVNDLLAVRATLRRGYLRAINDLARAKLPPSRRAEFEDQQTHRLVDLHGFIMNEDILNDIEPLSESESETDDEAPGV